MSGAITIVTALFVAFRLDRSSDTHRDESEPGAAVPVAERAPTGTLIARIKASCFATFCYGYFQSSVVLFLPLSMKAEKAIPSEQTRLITFFFAGGMLLATNFAGRIGDRHGLCW